MITTFKRYWSAMSDAWANRHQLGERNRHRDELAFLPAALEIQEQPPSPAGRILGWALMCLATIGVGWSCIGKVDIVAVADGKIIPSGRVKQIQPLEKGVVKTIYVTEGQPVKEGDPLVELDQTLTRADQTRLLSDLRFTQLALARQRALQHLLERQQAGQPVKLARSDDLPITWEQVLSDAEQSSQRLLLWQHWLDYQSRLGALESQLENRKAERRASAAVIEKLESTLSIITKRAQSLKTLYTRQLAPEHEYLELEQQRIEKRQDLSAEQARQAQLAAGIQEAEYQIANLNAELGSQTLNQIEESERQIASLTQELNKARDLNARQVLYAPVDGRVQQLAVHTVGGVVTEAQPLMLIVPQENFLEVEATLENKDIGFVHKGQEAEVKVNTFPFTKYGVVDAEVIDITADAIESEQQGLVYKLRLKMHSSQLWVNEQWVELLPGMAVSAEVKTGQRRLIEFFMAPLLRYRQESVWER